MRKEMARLKKLEARMLYAPDKQVSLTDPDARSMKTSKRGAPRWALTKKADTYMAENHFYIFVVLHSEDTRTLAVLRIWHTAQDPESLSIEVIMKSSA